MQQPVNSPKMYINVTATDTLTAFWMNCGCCLMQMKIRPINVYHIMADHLSMDRLGTYCQHWSELPGYCDRF